MADLGQHIGSVARSLLGEPNERLSSERELRFGSNGSLAVDLEKGRWYDHEAETGGNVVELIESRAGVKNGGVRKWLQDHGIEGESPPAPLERKEIEATFDYTDENGELLYQTVRFRFVGPDGSLVRGKDGKPKKTFSQRRPDAKGGWVWSLKGVIPVPYRLADLQEAVASDRTVFVVEGEKHVDRLYSLGIPATTSPMGAGKWPDSFAQYFRGAHVVILPDNDDAGRKHADLVGSSLIAVAASVRVLELRGLPPKGDVLDWLDKGWIGDDLYTVADAAPLWGEKPPALHFGAVWFADAEHSLQEPHWLVHEMLTCGDKSLVYGPSQSGKSFLATHIALGVARGETVFDRKVRRGGVIYIAAEGKKGFKKRLKAYRTAFDLEDNATLPFLLVPYATDLYNEQGDVGSLLEDLALVRPAMERMGVTTELVVIDTLAAVSPGANENASEDMSRIIRNCEQIQEVTNGHVMIVHHKNAAGDRPRGHTSLYAAADNAIEVMCDDFKNRTAKIAKLKDAEDGASIGFRLQSVNIGSDDDGKPITSCVVVPAQAGMARTSERKRSLTPQAAVALQALRYALAEYGEPAPGMLQLPTGIRVVKFRYWADRFGRVSFEGENEKQQAVWKALQRAGEKLLSLNIIGRNNPYVWIVREPEGRL